MTASQSALPPIGLIPAGWRTSLGLRHFATATTPLFPFLYLLRRNNHGNPFPATPHPFLTAKTESLGEESETLFVLFCFFPQNTCGFCLPAQKPKSKKIRLSPSNEEGEPNQEEVVDPQRGVAPRRWPSCISFAKKQAEGEGNPHPAGLACSENRDSKTAQTQAFSVLFFGVRFHSLSFWGASHSRTGQEKGIVLQPFAMG